MTTIEKRQESGKRSLIFLNRYFHPDHSATSQMLSDLAFALAEIGNSVCIITSRQRYDASTVRLPARETINGVEVHRVWTSRFGRHNLLGRAIDYATFYLSSALMLWRLTRSSDVVIAKTDPPILSVIVAPVARLRGAKLVNWLQDLFPEVAQALGVGNGPLASLVYRLLRWMRNKSLHAAEINIVLGEHMADRLSQLGLAKTRIRIIPNWADGALLAPIDRDRNSLRADWDLNGKFVVGYSGNLGRAHEIDTILDAIQVLETGKTTRAGHRDQTRTQQAGAAQASSDAPQSAQIVWLFIGGGAQFENLKSAVTARGLHSVQFKPYQPRERLSESLGVADAHLISLRPELEGLIVPSKFYGIAAAGRPAIFIGDEDGELARILSRSQTGFVVAQGDFQGLAHAVRKLANNPDTASALGTRARTQFENIYDIPHAVAAWEQIIDDLQDNS